MSDRKSSVWGFGSYGRIFKTNTLHLPVGVAKKRKLGTGEEKKEAAVVRKKHKRHIVPDSESDAEEKQESAAEGVNDEPSRGSVCGHE